jgi:hypothetical protein
MMGGIPWSPQQIRTMRVARSGGSDPGGEPIDEIPDPIEDKLGPQL